MTSEIEIIRSPKSKLLLPIPTIIFEVYSNIFKNAIICIYFTLKTQIKQIKIHRKSNF